jgi:phosphatidylserine/phosphatidylglycerophosphate/cardiolipin synthase-like enzyme
MIGQANLAHTLQLGPRMRLGLLAICALVPACVEPAESPAADDPLPVCASSYARAIHARTHSVLHKGSVSAARYASGRNMADPDVLIDGPEIFPAMRALIRSARHEVSLQTYVWEPGSDPANEILSGLIDLVRRRELEPEAPPVTVRFLFDVSTLGFGSSVTALPRAWADIEALDLDPRHVRFELAGFPHVTFGALHVKTVVVDGRRAIITGANPQAHHDYAEPWRDAGFRIAGEVALALQDDFDDAWARAKRWTCGSAERSFEECAVDTQPIEHAFPFHAGVGDDCLTMLVVTRGSDPTIGNNRLDNPQAQAFLAAFAAATSHIHIQTPNLNDDAAKQALLAAVQRGVRVDVVLSKGFNDTTEALPGQGGTNEKNVDELYEALEAAGVSDPCSKLRFRWHAKDGVAVVGNGHYASHAKYASVDDAIAIVGTANMDTQSWNHSREVNVVVDDPEITQAWDAQLFVADFEAGVQVDRCAR